MQWKYDDKSVTKGKIILGFVMFIVGTSAAYWGWWWIEPIVSAALGLVK